MNYTKKCLLSNATLDHLPRVPWEDRGRKVLFITLMPIFLLWALSLQADTATPAPAVSATPPSNTETTTPPPNATGNEGWDKKWTAKYVIATPREAYVHVLIDAQTLHGQLEGADHHSAVALEALKLVRVFQFPKNSSDLVKLDIVYFKNRDSYGAPLWDSVVRIGHLEFSRKALAQASPEIFLKAEGEWKVLFQTVRFYDQS